MALAIIAIPRKTMPHIVLPMVIEMPDPKLPMWSDQLQNPIKNGQGLVEALRLYSKKPKANRSLRNQGP